MYIYRRFLNTTSSIDNPHGFTLVMTLMFLAILTIVGSIAITINSTDLLLGGAFQASQTAFHNADAGVNFASSQITALVARNKLRLDGTKRTESYKFKRPSGFAFNIARRSTFKRIANTRKYLLQVTGYSNPNSPIKNTVEVVLQRRPALEYGLFVANRLDLPAQGRILSYDSRRIDPHHLPTASTSIAKIASSGIVSAQAGHLDLDVDGDIILSDTPAGERASFTFREASPDVSPPPVEITTGENHQINLLPGDALAPDPLDVNGMVETAQKRLRRRNHNRRALRDKDNRITTSAYLGKGNYYLKEIALGSGHFLILDATRGDINIYADAISFEGQAKFLVITDREHGNVNLYLDGPVSLNDSSFTNRPTLHLTGDPSTFRLFSSSNAPITFNHKGHFKGVIYAPYAPVTVRNTSAHGYGLLWGDTLDFSQNNRPYTFYTDTALQELFLSQDIEIVSWKALRDLN